MSLKRVLLSMRLARDDQQRLMGVAAVPLNWLPMAACLTSTSQTCLQPTSASQRVWYKAEEYQPKCIGSFLQSSQTDMLGRCCWTIACCNTVSSPCSTNIFKLQRAQSCIHMIATPQTTTTTTRASSLQYRTPILHHAQHVQNQTCASSLNPKPNHHPEP